MFCPECGIRITDALARFCPECGTALPEVHEGGPDGTSAPVGKQAEEEACGVILTNLSLLASKLGLEAATVSAILQDFVAKKRQSGVDYRIVDAGCYTFHKRPSLWRSATVSLKADSEVWDYMAILKDVCCYEHWEDDSVLHYLFILGGDDIIPMPCIRHYIAGDKNDDTIDTDILYAYPYGREMLDMLESREIFRYEPLFVVGRLPFAADAVAADLVSYLNRDLANSAGIVMRGAYGQCDPHWKNVSARVSAALTAGDYLRNFDGRLSSSYYYHRLILSPEVNISNVDQIFHMDASLYYYNLHGSDALDARGYFGVPMGETGAVGVLAPEHMASCHEANIVVCEACYGGRFIGHDKAHSMLLSALSARTLLFVGSSRVAWGCVDTQYSTPSSAAICHADVMAVTFMNRMLEGYVAGEAFWSACRTVLDSRSADDLYAALTVTEFNLFGDPTLFLHRESGKQCVGAASKGAPLVSGDVLLGCKIESIGNGSDGTQSSLLQQVRGAVDANIKKIHENLSRYLYDSYGLSPRPADGVFKLTYADGHKEMKFDYDYTPAGGHACVRMTVITDEGGEIKNVFASR